MQMRIDIFTIFPQMFDSPCNAGILKRAADQGLVSIKVHNIRDYAHDRHHTVDDSPYGGGPGMIFKPEPVFEAVETVRSAALPGEGIAAPRIVLLTPRGRLLAQDVALELSREACLMLICGHYEGVDERIPEHLATTSISIGDYVLSGGELAAMVVTDAVVRLIPGVLGSADSPVEESHTSGLLEYPQYTRPPEYRGWSVPEVLLSGNHAAIRQWRREQSIVRTLTQRPDMLDKATLTSKERDAIRQLQHPEEMV
jgi:tRNA (guanine37-N1)-methyltransferase